MSDLFDYQEAFSRNIGWLSKNEQLVLAQKRIAIAGMGGVGGSHLLTLTRLGVGGFNLSDYDRFELANFNRQAGARTSSLNEPKLDVLVNMALDINPRLEINVFPQGIAAENVHTFLKNMDLYVDGLDFFALDARRSVFSACAELGIPATTAAPFGMGTALLNFLPGKMTFEEYFRLEGLPEFDQLLRFYLGLAPKMLQARYLVDPTTIDLYAYRGPSTAMGCELCAGVAATQVLKILLNRGNILAAPHGLQFDAFENKLSKTWRPWGAYNPLQKLLFTMAKKSLIKTTLHHSKELAFSQPQTAIERIMDFARWAPSGDNSQPWRFEIIGDSEVVIYGFDTREHCVYDLEGHASQLSLGILIETIIIAASEYNYSVSYRLRGKHVEENPIIEIKFSASNDIVTSSLLCYVKTRSVQRRALSTREISRSKYQELVTAVGDDFSIAWFDGLGNRLRFSKLLFNNGQLRLRLPEAFDTHRNIIQWNAAESEDKIPDRALGASKLTLLMMHWALQSWNRVSFLNRYLAGTITPGIELDLIPAIFCGAHFMVLANEKPGGILDYIEAGRATQRFWLTATRLGLLVQPAYTPIVFHEYVTGNIEFTKDSKLNEKARAISDELVAIAGPGSVQRIVFMGRIGYGTGPKARSTRLPLKILYNGDEKPVEKVS